MYYVFKQLSTGMRYEPTLADKVGQAFKQIGSPGEITDYGISITHLDPRISYLKDNKRRYTQEYLDSLKEEEKVAA